MKQYTRILLEKIRDNPEGAWNNDPVQYRENVIQWMQDIVKAALEYEADNTLGTTKKTEDK